MVLSVPDSAGDGGEGEGGGGEGGGGEGLGGGGEGGGGEGEGGGGEGEGGGGEGVGGGGEGGGGVGGALVHSSSAEWATGSDASDSRRPMPEGATRVHAMNTPTVGSVTTTEWSAPRKPP